MNFDSQWSVLKCIEALAEKVKDGLHLLHKKQKEMTTENLIIESFKNQKKLILDDIAPAKGLYTPQYMKSQQVASNAEKLQMLDKLQKYQSDIEFYQRENEQLQKMVLTHDQDEEWLRNEIQRLEIDYKQREKDQQLLQAAIQRQKEYELLVVRASQEIKRKEDESMEKNKAITKAQSIILKLNEEIERLQQVVHEQETEVIFKLQGDLSNMREVYAKLHQSHQKLELESQNNEQTFKQLDKLSKQQLEKVQKQAEDIINHYKNELLKHKHPTGSSAISSKNVYFSKERDLDMRRSQSTSRLNGDGGSSSPYRGARQASIIYQTTPKGRASINGNTASYQNDQLSHNKKGVTFADKISTNSAGGYGDQNQAINNHQDDHLIGASKSVQVALDAFERTCQELFGSKNAILALTCEQQAKVLKLTTITQELCQEYVDKVEQQVNKEGNLMKQIEKRDKQINELKAINIESQYCINKLSQHLQEVYKLHVVKEQIYQQQEQEKEEEVSKQTAFFKETLQQFQQDVVCYQNEIVKVKQQCQLLQDANEVKQKQLEEETGNLHLKSSELEGIYVQLSEEKEKGSSSIIRYERLVDCIKEVWLKECYNCSKSAAASTNIQLIDENSQPIELIKDLHDSILTLKNQNENQKDECYQLLQQMTTQDQVNDSLNSLSNQPNSQSDYFTVGGGNARLNDYMQRRQSYQGNQLPSKSLVVPSHGNSIISQGKNELYNLLREEIKRMQFEINNKNTTNVQLKKQIEQADKAYKQKYHELEKMMEDNQKMKEEVDQLTLRANDDNDHISDLEQNLKEKDDQMAQLQEQIELFEQDVLAMQTQMGEIMDENCELNQSQQQWQEAYKELENKVVEINNDRSQLAEQFSNRENQFKEKILALKIKSTEKEQVIYDLRSSLEKEIQTKIEATNKIKMKQQCVKSVSVNTEDDFISDLEQENIEIREELQQVRHDITVVLDSYDQLRRDNEILQGSLQETRESNERAYIEKNQLQSLLQQEREFLDKVRKVEQSYSQIIGGGVNRRGGGANDQSDIITQQQQQQQFDAANWQHNHFQDVVSDFSQIRPSSQNKQQTRLGGGANGDSTKSVHKQAVGNFLGHLDPKNYRSQQQLKICKPNIVNTQTTAQTANTTPCQGFQSSVQNKNLGNNLNTMFTCNEQSQSQLTSYQLHTGSAQTIDTATNDKENFAQNLTIAADNKLKKEIKAILKKKMRNSLKHFEAILNFIETQISGQPQQYIQQRPPSSNGKYSNNKSSSSNNKLLLQQQQPNEEILFYQAQSYFYTKNTAIYNKIQSLFNGSLKTIGLKQTQLQWSFVQATRKLAATCLEGAIIVNNEKFASEIKTIKDFLSEEVTTIYEREPQLLQSLDQMLEGISKITQSACQIILRGGISQTSTVMSPSKSSDISQSFSLLPTASPHRQIPSFSYEQQHSDKLVYVEARIKDKLQLLSKLQQQLQQSCLASMQQIEGRNQDIQQHGSLWKLVSCLSRFTSCLKLELNFDCLTVGQVIKQLGGPRSSMAGGAGSFLNFDHSENQCSINGENMKSLIGEIESIKFSNSSSSRRQSSKGTVTGRRSSISEKQLNAATGSGNLQGHIKKMKRVIDSYDSRFREINERLVPEFVNRLIIKIRKEIAQQQRGSSATGNMKTEGGDKSLRKLRMAIDELEANLNELNGEKMAAVNNNNNNTTAGITSSKSQRDQTEEGLVMILKENLELRKFVEKAFQSYN